MIEPKRVYPHRSDCFRYDTMLINRNSPKIATSRLGDYYVLDGEVWAFGDDPTWYVVKVYDYHEWMNAYRLGEFPDVQLVN